MHSNLVEFDPEIERTLRLIRIARRRLFDTSFVEDSSTDNSTLNSPISVSNPNFSNNFVFAENIGSRTLKELAAADVNYQALAIQYPDLDADF